MLFAFFWVIGTVTNDSGETDTAAPTTSAAPVAAPRSTESVASSSAVPSTSSAPTGDCPAVHPISDPELDSCVKSLGLLEGVLAVTGRVSKDSRHPGQVGAAVDLCVPASTSADALHPIQKRNSFLILGRSEP